MKTPEEIAAQIESCVLIPQETDFLMEHARSAQYGLIEVGSLHGRSSIFLGIIAKEKGVPLLCVDVWRNAGNDDLPIWKKNIEAAGLSDVITPMRMLSVEAATVVWRHFADKFDFLFIDAEHTYQDVKADFEAWTPILRRPASVIFHDIGNSNVRDYFNELCEDYDFIINGNIGGIFLQGESDE
jgi:predicted O-methyltransferase YrrM